MDQSAVQMFVCMCLCKGPNLPPNILVDNLDFL